MEHLYVILYVVNYEVKIIIKTHNIYLKPFIITIQIELQKYCLRNTNIKYIITTPRHSNSR